MAREQAARQDPQAEYAAFCKAQALRIIQAAARAKGLPVPTRLVQDDEPSDEYPNRDNYNSPGNPDDGGDDQPHPKDRKGKEKGKPAKADDDENGDEQADGGEPRDEGGDDFDSDDEKKKRDKVAALLIINAGRRRDGLPLLTLRDML